MATQKNYSPKAEKLITQWLGKKAGRELLIYLRTQLDDDGSERYPDVDRRITELIPPFYLSPPPEHVPGAHFDASKVDRFIKFCRLVTHIKGPMAGQFFELELWQIIFIFGPVLCWLDGNGYRIIRTSYGEVGKKNGKSTAAAIFGLYMASVDGEQGAEVVAVAGIKEQALAVFDVARWMTNNSPELSKRLRVYKDQITREDTASWFKVMGSGGAYKAGLNIHAAIIDELLVHKTRELVENLEGATAARRQPIIMFLSTGGTDDPGSIYAEKRNYAESVANKIVDDPTWHTAIWTLSKEDELRWDQEDVWPKANPNMGASVQLEFLRTKAKQARANPTAINKFKRDHLNLRTGMYTRWLDVAQWDRSNSSLLMPASGELLGRTAYMGLDLSSTTDLTALSLVIPTEVPNPKNPDEVITIIDIIIRAWTPLATIEDRAERDKAPYLQWLQEGWLTGVEGNVIDYDEVEKCAKELGEIYGIQRMHFDRWGSKQIVQHLTDWFGDHTVFEMGQGFASMTAPMKEMERKVLAYEVRHQANPLLRYAVQSLAIQSDPAGNVKPDRKLSTGRIDPFVASVMALDAWMRSPVFVSAYEPQVHSA